MRREQREFFKCEPEHDVLIQTRSYTKYQSHQSGRDMRITV